MARTEPTTAGTAAETAAVRQGALTHRQILTILAGLQIGMFLAALDQMILATAIRTIADDLSGLRQEGWTLTTYLVAMAATTPLYGKLSDIHGRKPMFLLAISVFMVGSVACTFAMSMDQLALARGLQGLGAGGLISLGLAIIADIVPARERGRYQGYLLAIFVTSSVLGPVIGGVLAGQPTILGITGWRWVFLVNVPVGLVALVVVAKGAQRAVGAPVEPGRLARLGDARRDAGAAATRRRTRAPVGLGVAGVVGVPGGRPAGVRRVARGLAAGR